MISSPNMQSCDGDQEVAEQMQQVIGEAVDSIMKIPESGNTDNDSASLNPEEVSNETKLSKEEEERQALNNIGSPNMQNCDGDQEVTEQMQQVLGEAVDSILKIPESDNTGNDSASLNPEEVSNETALSKEEEERQALNNIGEMNLQAMEEMENEEKSNTDKGFIIGDHVYRWCSLIGIPGVFQHHGIVIDVDGSNITIADFSGMITVSSSIGGSGTEEASSLSTGAVEPEDEADANPHHDENQEDTPQQADVQMITTQKKLLFPMASSTSATPGIRQHVIEESSEKTKWKKVQYQAGWLQRTFNRSGTCTITESDPVGLVLSRVRFLMERSDVMPHYDWLKANCECVAVWCKTGTWATLQASSFLEITTAGQMKSTATLAMYASSQTVSVPAAGVWGSWFGMTTKVSLFAAQPHLLPILAGYGVLTIGGPVWVLYRCNYAWDKHTSTLNDEFWSHAIEHPDVFVECITHWSDA